MASKVVARIGAFLQKQVDLYGGLLRQYSDGQKP
jgi:hypothetical protein